MQISTDQNAYSFDTKSIKFRRYLIKIAAILFCALLGALFYARKEDSLEKIVCNFNIGCVDSSVSSVINRKIVKGFSFEALSQELDLSTSTKTKIVAAVKGVYDLSKLKADNDLTLVLDQSTKQPQKIIYNIDAEQNLFLEEIGENEWTADLLDIPYEVKTEILNGTIEKSLYGTFMALDKDPRLAILLSEIFAWQIDFALDVQKNDYFKIIYEARYLDGEYKMPSKILAAEFINNGEPYRAYYFKSTSTREGYYDKDGKSLAKMFLKSPLQYKYISSYFSYSRTNPITKIITPHRAIDYAANYGTPVVSIGDGVAADVGWRGDYGLKILIRHNEVYKTIYGHLSSLAKGIRTGARIKQGQIIGYVGATGQATGPHLHFEMRKFDSFINPLLVKPPESQSMNESDKNEFDIIKARFEL